MYANSITCKYNDLDKPLLFQVLDLIVEHVVVYY